MSERVGDATKDADAIHRDPAQFCYVIILCGGRMRRGSVEWWLYELYDGEPLLQVVVIDTQRSAERGDAESADTAENAIRLAGSKRTIGVGLETPCSTFTAAKARANSLYEHGPKLTRTWENVRGTSAADQQANVIVSLAVHMLRAAAGRSSQPASVYWENPTPHSRRSKHGPDRRVRRL